MSAPGQAWVTNPVQVRTEQRLATSSELNPACNEVMSCTEPGGGRCRAATQVKGLSPEITNVENGPTRFISWQAAADLTLWASQADAPGSETVARHHMHNPGTWEIQAVAVGWQGPDNPQRRGGAAGSLEVGPAQSRGVARVMPCEPGEGTRRGRRSHGSGRRRHRPYSEVVRRWKRSLNE